MSTSEPTTDAQLMVAYCEGRIDAFGELYERYAPAIAAYLRRMSGRADMAESLAQETFLRVIENRRRFKPDHSFRAWLYAIARNLLKDQWKREARSPISDEEIDDALCASATPTPEELADLTEQRARLLEAMGRLPAAQREVIILHEFHRLTHKEIAEMRGEPVGTVRSRLFHALNALRESL